MEKEKNKKTSQMELLYAETQDDNEFLEILFKSGFVKKIGEGARGVVFAIDFSQMDDLQLEKIKKIFPELENEQNSPEKKAAKLIKIFSTETAVDEMNKQNLANSILEHEDSPVKGIVSAPVADEVHKIKIRDKDLARELSEIHNVKIVQSNPQACFILMDYIEGQTFEEIEAKEVLRRNIEKVKERYKLADAEPFIAGLKEDNLRNVVMEITGNIESREFLDYCDSLGKKLKGSKTFEKKTYEAVKEALEWLHKNGFYHRDLHLGNLMLGKDGKIYIIDFDQSKLIDPSNQEDVVNVYNVEIDPSRGVKRQKVQDGWVVKHLYGITSDQEAINQDRKANLQRESLINVFSKIPLFNNFIKNNDKLSFPDMVVNFANSHCTPGLGSEHTEYIIAGLIALSNEGKTNEAIDFATKKLNTQIPARQHNLYSNFIEYVSI